MEVEMWYGTIVLDKFDSSSKIKKRTAIWPNSFLLKTIHAKTESVLKNMQGSLRH